MSNDDVLSDVEEDDIPVKLAESSQPDVVSGEEFRELVAEFDREKIARVSAENSVLELQNKFNRLKSLTHEAIKKRDEATRENERLRGELGEVSKVKDGFLRELETVRVENERFRGELVEISKVKDGFLRELEAVKAEIEAGSQMLVTGIEKVSGKVNHIKNFTVGGLPKSQKYTGLCGVAYGVIKRANEIVEEVAKQIEGANKSRDEAREMVEQRNYEIAIEVSELEASISRLREEVTEKSSRIEGLEKCVFEKDERIGEIECGTEEKMAEMRTMVDDYEGRVTGLEAEFEGVRPLLVEQLSFVSKIHDQLYSVVRIVDVGNGDQSDFSESLFVPQETGLEENIRAALAGLESIFELSRVVSVKTKGVVEEKSRAVKSLNETVARLFREKEHVGVLLRSALSKRLTSNSTSETNAVFRVAENGLREAGIDFKFGAFFEDEKFATSQSKEGGQETKDDEIYELAGALENIIKEAQLQIIELQHSVEELRAESSLLKNRLETQAKELGQKKHRIEELELKEREADENIQGLMMDIAAAEEEISRWKGAAEQEAEAGSAVEQEFVAQISSLKQEIEEAKQAMAELTKKLKYKEETAEAAMAAREAAEKSLRLADMRASRLRDRIEELTHQLESLDNKDDVRSRTRPRYVCWPWEWLGIDFVGHQRQIEPPEHVNSNEMELSEPLL